jgi:hypothetical protein
MTDLFGFGATFPTLIVVVPIYSVRMTFGISGGA